MTEHEALKIVLDFFSSGGILPVFAAVVLLKKYIINGSLDRFFEYKRQEIETLKGLEIHLINILSNQEEIYKRLPYDNKSN